MTGYTLTKYINRRLRAEGLQEIRPQMTYNYLKKGYITDATEEAADVWLTKYITKKQNPSITRVVAMTIRGEKAVESTPMLKGMTGL